MSVLVVGLSSMFDWKWSLTDIRQDKEVSVFSCFACAGGSSMGYKKAGFKVIGDCEIDPRMNELYINNHHPKYNFCMDMRDFNALNDLPDDLFNIDILDGSPPCSVFSTAGQREKGWGKEKTFREGQKLQRLDDLFFVFLDTVEKLRPKIVVAENVTGLLKGNAKGYVNEIVARFRELGYSLQMFKLNAAFMDVPQARERVFFIANRMGYKPLVLDFNEPPILFGQVRGEHGVEITGETAKKRLAHLRTGDMDMSYITRRTEGKISAFGQRIMWDDRVAYTITSGGGFIRAHDKSYLSDDDIVAVQTFPQDFDFGKERVQYVCGMSVPPNMMAHIAAQIWEQWLK